MPLESGTSSSIRANPKTECNNVTCPAAGEITIRQPQAKGEPIGYFYFLDGGFRWDSLISFPKIKISNAKIVPAKLIKKVEPFYPAVAAAQHIFGTVRVYYVIGGDGAGFNAHVLSGERLC